MTEASGMASRGKYTLVIRLLPATRLLLALETPSWKSSQGSSPVK